MSEVVWTGAFYICLVLLTSVVLCFVIGFIGHITGQLFAPSDVKPQQPSGLPPLVCPTHGLEHVCQTDPYDTAILNDIEAYASLTDPKWHARMSGKRTA